MFAQKNLFSSLFRVQFGLSNFSKTDCRQTNILPGMLLAKKTNLV